MDAIASAALSSSGPCFARNRAISGIKLAYTRFNLRHNFAIFLTSFRVNHAGDAGEIVGYGDIRPVWQVEERLNGKSAVVP